VVWVTGLGVNDYWTELLQSTLLCEGTWVQVPCMPFMCYLIIIVLIIWLIMFLMI